MRAKPRHPMAKPPDIAGKKYDNNGTMNPFEGFGVII